MKKYYAECSYLGTHYNGWQKQPNSLGIQEIIEDVFSKILSTNIKITGSSRTDAGVHAEMQTFHFEANNLIELNKLIYSANRVLPKDISIKKIKEVDKNFHARFSANFRRYEYKITTKKNPFLAETHLLVYKSLDLKKMNEAASFLIKKNLDCKVFSKEGMDVKNYFCSIKSAMWFQDGDIIIFSISSNRFLRGMVRIIVGYMLKIGEGKLSPLNFKGIVETKLDSIRPPLAPAHGLSLVYIR